MNINQGYRMKYLFFILVLLSLPTFAARFADDVRSMDLHKGEVAVTFRSHAQVYRIPAGGAVIPCLENGFKAKKPVEVTTNDENGNIVGCKLSPRMHPGAAGK